MLEWENWGLTDGSAVPVIKWEDYWGVESNVNKAIAKNYRVVERQEHADGIDPLAIDSEIEAKEIDDIIRRDKGSAGKPNNGE